MKIAYLDGYRFYRILQVGAHAIIDKQAELDSIIRKPQSAAI